MNRKDFFKALGLGVASIPFALSAKKKHEFTVLHGENVITQNGPYGFVDARTSLSGPGSLTCDVANPPFDCKNCWGTGGCTHGKVIIETSDEKLKMRYNPNFNIQKLGA